MADEVVAFTGEPSSMTRENAKALVLEHGGRAVDSVSRNVTLLVVGSGAGQKLDNARPEGLKVIDEDTFLEQVKD